jgi:hypothetical protein
MVQHVCDPSYYGDEGRKFMNLRSSQAKLVRPYLENKIQNKRTLRVVQIVEHLPNMCKALGSISSTERKNLKYIDGK